MDPRHERLGRERLEDRQLLGDPRGELAQDTPRLTWCDLERPVQLGARILVPATQLVAGRRPRLEAGNAVRGGQRRVEARAECTDVLRDLGRVLHA